MVAGYCENNTYDKAVCMSQKIYLYLHSDQGNNFTRDFIKVFVTRSFLTIPIPLYDGLCGINENLFVRLTELLGIRYEWYAASASARLSAGRAFQFFVLVIMR